VGGANSSPKCHSVLEGTSYLWISLLERRRNLTPILKRGREIMPYCGYKFPPTLISSPNLLLKMVIRTNPLHCVWWQNLNHPLIIAEGGM
jgi:hypothetical protein